MGESSNNGQKDIQNRQNNGSNHHNGKSFRRRNNGRPDKGTSNGGKNGVRPSSSENPSDDKAKQTAAEAAIKTTKISSEKENEKSTIGDNSKEQLGNDFSLLINNIAI